MRLHCQECGELGSVLPSGNGSLPASQPSTQKSVFPTSAMEVGLKIYRKKKNLKNTVTRIESWKSHFLPVGQNIHIGDMEVGCSSVL